MLTYDWDRDSRPMHYSPTYAASSPTVSRSFSPVSPHLRVPRYLRRYTVCAAAQHRPTSPLANSFIPDEYDYFRKAQDDDAATSSCAHNTSLSHALSSSSHHWHRQPPEPFIVNPGPKVHHCSYTTFPSPSAALSRAQSLVADVSSHPPPAHRLLRRSSCASQSSASSLSEYSFHTAVDEKEYNWDQSQVLQYPDDSPFEEPRPQSWVEPLSIKHDSSDSSNSGFRSSAFGFRGGQSSADTVVSPADDTAGISPRKEEKQKDDDDDEWPVTYLTTITRHELDEYEKENKPQERRRKFTWGRKEDRMFLTDKEREGTPTTESEPEVGRKKSRKLKKKRPDTLHTEDEIHSSYPTFDTPVIPIYTEGEQEEFDPLKDFPTHEGPEAGTVLPDETVDEMEVGIAISSDDLQGEGHPFNLAIEVILSGRNDEWEDVESADHHGYLHLQGQTTSEDDEDIDAILERIRSRTPQEILQGLDVVHEEEEEDSVSEAKVEDAVKCHDLEKRGSYPFIKNKGKRRQNIHGETMEGQDILHNVKRQVAEGCLAGSEEPIARADSTAQPIPKPQDLPPPRRRKLSKRRRSRRKLNTVSPPPPLPEQKPRSESSKSTNREGEKRRIGPTSKKPSVPTLRPRRTPKTLISSVTHHIFRPFAHLLGIDEPSPRRRLSRELRTPNGLVAGRHFSGKHIPRFPSRLDGSRSVDKKTVKYE